MLGVSTDRLSSDDRRSTAKRIFGSTTALWFAFVITHVVLAALAFMSRDAALGDIEKVYRGWAQQALDEHLVVGIDASWVYPIVAIVPILIAALGGLAAYLFTWFTLVFVVDSFAFAVLVGGWRSSPKNVVAAWWWIGFLLLLGPIALARIDSIAVPIVIVGLLWVTIRPRVAGALLAIATWIKVWPGAVVVAVTTAARERWRVLVGALVMSGAVVGAALLLGSGTRVFSFITEQTGRGLQIEAPVSGIYVWDAVFGSGQSRGHYNYTALTYEIAGPGSEVVAKIVTPLLAAVAAAILIAGALAVRRGGSYRLVLPPLVLALVTALIAFNKVGSPQFIGWLAAPVILGLVYQGRGFRFPAILVAIIGVLTQVVYPYLYGLLLDLNVAMVIVLTARNLLYVVLLGWALRCLWVGSRADGAKRVSR